MAPFFASVCTDRVCMLDSIENDVLIIRQCSPESSVGGQRHVCGDKVKKGKPVHRLLGSSRSLYRRDHGGSRVK